MYSGCCIRSSLVDGFLDPRLNAALGPLDALAHCVVVCDDESWEVSADAVENFSRKVTRRQSFSGNSANESNMLLLFRLRRMVVSVAVFSELPAFDVSAQPSVAIAVLLLLVFAYENLVVQPVSNLLRI